MAGATVETLIERIVEHEEMAAIYEELARLLLNRYSVREGGKPAQQQLNGKRGIPVRQTAIDNALAQLRAATNRAQREVANLQAQPVAQHTNGEE